MGCCAIIFVAWAKHIWGNMFERRQRFQEHAAMFGDCALAQLGNCLVCHAWSLACFAGPLSQCQSLSQFILEVSVLHSADGNGELWVNLQPALVMPLCLPR